MNDINWKNCRVHKNIRFFTPNTVLIETDDGNITVSMADEALDFILGKIALKSLLVGVYKKANMVFQALKKMFTNQTPPRHSKEDKKAAIDVLGNIRKEMAKTDMEKEKIERIISVCKMMIDGFARC